LAAVEESSERQQALLRHASIAARAGDMTGFLRACHRADTSAYGVLATLQSEEGLLPEQRANLATVARLMDCYRGKHGQLPFEQGADRPRRRWFGLR
jgi:hypothetical protein